jgi:hypothetical protein
VNYHPFSNFSLVILLLAPGADRLWDEEGSKAYERAVKDAGTKKPATDKTPLAGVTIPDEDLAKAFPVPYAFLLGWTLFGLSYFSPVDGSEGFQVSWDAIVSAFVCLAIGWIASVPMGDAVQKRNAAKKRTLGMMFVGSWLVLTVVSGWGELTPLHGAFRFAGAVCIIASMKILWKYRKMGDTWEQEGKPNPNPVVYNIGGPLFVFGWFLFWVGVASSTEDCTGIPLYFTARSALAFLTGSGMVPVVMLVDYAHDEGAEWLGFGTDGRFFGRFWESPIPFVLSWTGFGFASWFPLPLPRDITPLQWIILANCVAQGIVAGLLIQTALYKGDLAGKTRWSIPFVLLFLALAAELGHTGGLRLALSLPGALFIIAGQKTVFGDRKRGDYWMETGNVNPNPIVYSYGEPLFMTGWLMMSLVMSMPM